MSASAIAFDTGHDLLAPEPAEALFGAPRFTPEQQAANPTARMTRVVKDVLHVGTWRVRDEANGNVEVDWTITPRLLAAIASAHDVGRSRGVATNLGKTHGDRATRLIHPDDLIAPVTEFKSDGRILWASVYVTPATAEWLSNPALKVSPYIVAGWRDTGGHTYPAKVLHVAVTDNPVIPGQGPFRIAMCDPMTKRERPMSLRNLLRLPRASKPLFAVALAEGDEVVDDTVGDAIEEPGTHELEGAGVETAIELFRTLLDAAYGLTLPDDVDGLTVIDTVARYVEVAQQLSGASADDSAAEVVDQAAGAIAASGTAAPATKRKPSPRIKLALKKAEERGARKAKYEFALSQAAESGTPAATIERLRKLGPKLDYDTELLGDLPVAVPMGNPLLGRRVDGSAPSVASRAKPRPEDVAANTDRILGRFGRRRPRTNA